MTASKVLAASTSFGQLKAVSVSSNLAREMASMEQKRASWRQAMTQSIGAVQQLREFTQVGSDYSQIVKDITEFRSAASKIRQQFKELLADTSPAAQAVKAWQGSQREQQEHIHKMLEPLADIRKSFMVDDTIRHQMRESALGTSVIRAQVKEALPGLSGVGAVAKMWAQQMDGIWDQARNALESWTLESTINQMLKDFEHVNKQWMVAPELLGVVVSLKELQSQIGRVTLPTIDWGSAAALATLLGQEGLEEQLAHLGIEPDGSLHNPKGAPEKGLLSRKQSDALALLSLLLTLISIWMTLQIFYYQEAAGTAQQVKNDEQAAKQMRQLESLNHLVEQALRHTAQAQEEHFVVRDHTATVRSKPKYGSPVEGKLMPNEVVRAIDKDGKWVKVEYYHWLHEEYRIGWVLKKYLERVPLNFLKTNS